MLHVRVLFISLVVALLTVPRYVAGLQRYAEEYTSPVPDMYDPENTLSTYTVSHEEDCVLRCLATEHCVAVSVRGAEDGNGDRECQLKDHLLTLAKFLRPEQGASYYHVVVPPFTRTGCFKHSTRSNFRSVSLVYRADYNKWQEEDYGQMVLGCAALGWRRGYAVFGLEFSGECWVTDRSVDYRADGNATDNDWEGCIYNVGIQNEAISVFEFN